MNDHPPNPDGAHRGLPLRGRNAPRRVILASHLIFTGYAHWLPNDPRGSGSDQIRNDALKPLGRILPGRQFPQPPRDEVKQFFHNADPRIQHERVWFKDAHRQTVANAFREIVRTHGYVIWAFAVMTNHAHAVVRSHRDRSEIIWRNLAQQSAKALQERGLVPANHPVWSHRPYKVFLYTKEDVLGRIRYVQENPLKEGLPPQQWDFIVPFA